MVNVMSLIGEHGFAFQLESRYCFPGFSKTGTTTSDSGVRKIDLRITCSHLPVRSDWLMGRCRVIDCMIDAKPLYAARDARRKPLSSVASTSAKQSSLVGVASNVQVV